MYYVGNCRPDLPTNLHRYQSSCGSFRISHARFRARSSIAAAQVLANEGMRLADVAEPTDQPIEEAEHQRDALF